MAYATRTSKPLTITDWDERAMVIVNDNLEKLWDITNGRVDEINVDFFFKGSGTGLPYGCIEGTDETVVCTVQNTWYQVTFDTVGQSNLTTVNITNGEITILKSGVYVINITACFHSANSQDWELIVRKNDGAVDVGVHLFQTTAVADKVENTTGSCEFKLSANDRIELWVRCTSAANRSAVFDHVNLHCFMVGG